MDSLLSCRRAEALFRSCARGLAKVEKKVDDGRQIIANSNPEMISSHIPGTAGGLNRCAHYQALASCRGLFTSRSAAEPTSCSQSYSGVNGC